MSQKFRKQNINRFEDFLAKESFTELESIFLERMEGEKRIHSDYSDLHRNAFIKELKTVLIEWVEELRRGYTTKAVEKELGAYQTFMYYLDNTQQMKELPIAIDKKKQKVEAKGFEWNEKNPKTQIKNLYELLTNTSKFIKSESHQFNIPTCFIDMVELVAVKTDFFEHIEPIGNQILYRPMVVMKWKNNSDQSITDKIHIEGIFIDNSKEEELSETAEYLTAPWSTPLQSNLSRQIFLESSVGYTNVSSIYYANISCKILINTQVFNIIKIDNDLLSSNRIQ